MAQNMKFIAGADGFGCPLKDALVSHLRSLDIEVDELGIGAYYSIGEQVGRHVTSSSSETTKTLGLVSCGIGAGVQIFANKIPGIYDATCLTVDEAVNARSINNANILAVSSLYTSPQSSMEILKTFIETTFKSTCPALNGKYWDPEIQTFLDESVSEMAKIGAPKIENCVLCYLAKNRELEPVEIMPGGMMKIVTESPTLAMVNLGSVRFA